MPHSKEKHKYLINVINPTIFFLYMHVSWTIHMIPSSVNCIRVEILAVSGVCGVLFYPKLQWSWRGWGYTGFTLSVCLSVCGQNRVRSVFSTILARPISYFHILSTNFRRCVACWFFLFQNFNFCRNFLVHDDFAHHVLYDTCHWTHPWTLHSIFEISFFHPWPLCSQHNVV